MALLLNFLLFSSLVAGSLASEAFFDKTKIIEIKCMDYKKAANADADWFKEQDEKGWHYAMGNRDHAVIIAEALTGKRPKNLDTFKDACLKLSRDDAGYTITGFGATAAYECNTNFGKKACYPTDKSTNLEWAAKRGTDEATIVWTDNKKYALAFRCSAMHSQWSLRSADNSAVDADTKKAVLAYIKKAGFKTDLAVEYPNEGCE